MSDDKLKIAVFIDFDNIEIGVKTTLGQHFDVGAVLESIKERGEIVTKFAYGDWTRAGDYGRAMSQNAIHMVQRNLTPGGDKNGADINLALDALEMAFTHNHINTFVIVGGDSDFISLVEKLKQYDRKVFVVGGRSFTSVVMQKNCTEFLAYENLVSRGRPAPRGSKTASTSGDLSQAMPLVRRALKLLADREVLPQLGLLKSTLLQLDSAFSERDYGASTFRDFVQKLASAGYVTLKGNDRSFHVELREGAEAGERTERGERHPIATPPPATDVESTAAPETEETGAAPEPAKLASPEALRLFHQAFAQPKSAPRWPLYVRQVKQAVKAVDPGFDERAYGFGGIIEALRYCQREGLFRIERDRLGVVRVFPGPLLQKPTTEPVAAGPLLEGTTAETPSGPHPVEPAASVDTEAAEAAAAATGTAGRRAREGPDDPPRLDQADGAPPAPEVVAAAFDDTEAPAAEPPVAAPPAPRGRRRPAGEPGSRSRKTTGAVSTPRKRVAAPRGRRKPGSGGASE